MKKRFIAVLLFVFVACTLFALPKVELEIPKQFHGTWTSAEYYDLEIRADNIVEEGGLYTDMFTDIMKSFARAFGSSYNPVVSQRTTGDNFYGFYIDSPIVSEHFEMMLASDNLLVIVITAYYGSEVYDTLVYRYTRAK